MCRHIFLSATRQIEILKHAKDIPIIGEFDFGTKESLKKEFEYLKEGLQREFDTTAQ